MKSKILLAVLFTMVLVNSSEACNRCGLFGNRCRFKSNYSYYYPARQQVRTVYAQPQTITIQNNYNGALTSSLTNPLALQGNTVYGYQSGSYLQRLNREGVLNQAARLVENAQRLSESGLSQYTSTLNLELQGDVEVAKILAATEHLKAANVGAQSGASVTQSITTRTVNGKTTVQTDPGTSSTPSTEPPPAPPLNTEGMIIPQGAPEIFKATCYKCHSGQTPKGDFSLDFEAYTPQLVTKALRAIKSGKMPPPNIEALSAEQKGQIMSFLLDSDETKEK